MAGRGTPSWAVTDPSPPLVPPGSADKSEVELRRRGRANATSATAETDPGKPAWRRTPDGGAEGHVCGTIHESRPTPGLEWGGAGRTVAPLTGASASNRAPGTREWRPVPSSEWGTGAGQSPPPLRRSAPPPLATETKGPPKRRGVASKDSSPSPPRRLRTPEGPRPAGVVTPSDSRSPSLPRPKRRGATGATGRRGPRHCPLLPPFYRTPTPPTTAPLRWSLTPQRGGARLRKSRIMGIPSPQSPPHFPIRSRYPRLRRRSGGSAKSPCRPGTASSERDRGVMPKHLVRDLNDH